MTIRFYIVVFFIFSLFGLWYTSVAPPRGDELHYLVTAHSIVYDRDLYLENNYENRDYAPYYSGVIDRHSVIGRDGHEYLYHGLGLFPLLISPFYSLGGREAVVIFLVFVYTLLLWEIHKQTKSYLVLIFILTLPLYAFSILIFPEIVAALFFLRIIRKIWKPSWLEWGLVGLLPWIHLRFLPPAFVLFALMVIFAWRKNFRLLLIPILEIGLYFCFHFFVYGSFSPNAPYTKLGIATGGANILQNIIMAFSDSQYGLFFVSPIYIFAFSSSIILGAKKKIYFLPLIILAIYSIFVFRYYDWHGGYAPPARYLATFLPLFIPGCVYLVKKLNIWHKLIFFFFSAWGILIAILTITSSSFGFLFLDGQVPSLNKMSQFLGINIRDFFPTFYPERIFSPLHIIWFFLSMIICAILVKTYATKNFDTH